MDVRHQLNCLRDEARATRRRALSRLSAWLDDEGGVEADDVMDEFVDKGRVLPVGARARAAARDVCGQVVVADEHASLVGVFISVTTVPAAAFASVALVEGRFAEAAGSALQLLVNIVGIVLAAVLVLLLSRRAGGRRHRLRRLSTG